MEKNLIMYQLFRRLTAGTKTLISKTYGTGGEMTSSEHYKYDKTCHLIFDQEAKVPKHSMGHSQACVTSHLLRAHTKVTSDDI